MFFESVAQVLEIVKKAGTVVLCLNDGTMVGGEKFSVPEFMRQLGTDAILVQPVEGHIGVDQVREVIEMCGVKQAKHRFFVFENAENLRPEAANALLKLLEEPGDNYHFILLVANPGALLPTIRSRAATYAPLMKHRLLEAPSASDDVLALAKRILVAKPAEIVEIAEALAKKKPDERREYALGVIATAVELAYKSYFKTGNVAFTAKIPGLVAAHAGISANGNLKLQFIANLV